MEKRQPLIKYAGIGSRETPLNICNKMSLIGRSLYKQGFILRSGRAIGADQAFEKFVPKGSKEIFIASDSINRIEWHDHASKYHPAWSRCSDWAKNLHARNSAIMLGDTLNDPVKFVICWTKNGKLIGGTAQAMRIAIDLSIPIFNLYSEEQTEKLREFIRTCNH